MPSVGCTGAHYFIALGEIYRVAQILHISMLSFKPWVLADPGMLSKMLVCWNSCVNSWTSGLGMALTMVVDSKNLHAPVAKVLLESIININDIEVPNLQSFLPSDKMACKLTLLPTSLVPGKYLSCSYLFPAKDFSTMGCFYQPTNNYFLHLM
jgi:hypothetical protein